MFDSNNYRLQKNVVGGLTQYCIAFKDGQGAFQKTEVSRPVYLEFTRFAKAERNQRRWDERHIEQSSLTDETLSRRALGPQKSVVDTVIDNERNKQFRAAVQSLPEKQRRRFVLYHEFGLTYEQIAKREGCHFTSVSDSVKRAEEKIKYFRNNS